MVIIVWLVLAIAGDVALALAPFPPGQASDLASSESFTIQLLAEIGWPIFSGVLARALLHAGRQPPRTSN